MTRQVTPRKMSCQAEIGNSQELCGTRELLRQRARKCLPLPHPRRHLQSPGDVPRLLRSDTSIAEKGPAEISPKGEETAATRFTLGGVARAAADHSGQC